MKANITAKVSESVNNMKVAEMRKVAAQYGIKQPSKHRRPELTELLVNAMVEVEMAKAAERAKATRKTKSTKKDNTPKRPKANKVEQSDVEALAAGLVASLLSGATTADTLAYENRKVLIVVMKQMHCPMWYRTYDKATMMAKLAEAVAKANEAEVEVA